MSESLTEVPPWSRLWSWPWHDQSCLFIDLSCQSLPIICHLTSISSFSFSIFFISSMLFHPLHTAKVHSKRLASWCKSPWALGLSLRSCMLYIHASVRPQKTIELHFYIHLYVLGVLLGELVCLIGFTATEKLIHKYIFLYIQYYWPYCKMKKKPLKKPKTNKQTKNNNNATSSRNPCFGVSNLFAIWTSSPWLNIQVHFMTFNYLILWAHKF